MTDKNLKMRSKLLKILMSELELSQMDIASLGKVNVRTVRNWVAGSSKVPWFVILYLKLELKLRTKEAA